MLNCKLDNEVMSDDFEYLAFKVEAARETKIDGSNLSIFNLSQLSGFQRLF